VSITVADAGPIISLVQIQRLDLAHSLSGSAAMPLGYARAARLVRFSAMCADEVDARRTCTGG